LSRYSQLTVIDDQINIPTALKMFSELQLDNQKLKAEITKAYRLAESANELGLSNFLQGRLDIHAKHGWMLRAIGK
jgi:DNA-binding ferritin-like protein